MWKSLSVIFSSGTQKNDSRKIWKKHTPRRLGMPKVRELVPKTTVHNEGTWPQLSVALHDRSTSVFTWNCMFWKRHHINVNCCTVVCIWRGAEPETSQRKFSLFTSSCSSPLHSAHFTCIKCSLTSYVNADARSAGATAPFKSTGHFLHYTARAVFV